MQIRDHYARQIDALHGELREFGTTVIDALTRAIHALDMHDVAAAQKIIADDRHINATQFDLERHVLVIIATQQPNARDLRRLMGVNAISGELERIGDYAKNIAKITLRNADQPRLSCHSQIGELARQAIHMLDMVLDAFIKLDAALAHRLAKEDDRADALSQQIRSELIGIIREDADTAAYASDLLAATHITERIADRTTNIAERIIFMVNGEIVELNP